MALPYQSIATISSPQFINLKPLDINPLMSSCEIKVLYLGENRNRSYISKQVAIEMSKTLRGAPIVGYFKQDKNDFADHGQQMIWDDEGIHFNTLTRPYGFVAPDAKVWFQKFQDTDEFGNTFEREYLMTTGYLWTGQFEQAQSVINEGKPQSMELDEETLQGHWAINVKTNVEFFIINDAIFTKICILGNDVQPCFEGASITKPEISSTFSHDVDENFKRTLFSMIKDLKDVLKGGNDTMEKEINIETTFVEQQESSAPEINSNLDSSTNFQQENPENTFSESVEDQESQTKEVVSDTFEKKDQEQKEEQPKSEQEETNQQDTKDQQKEDDDEQKKKYSLLESKYTALQNDFDELKVKYDELVSYKETIENEKKDTLIKEFYMLSEEDKADVIANKTKYSLEDIKAKLAIICYQKKVNFDLENNDKINNTIEEDIITFNYNDDSNLPDWVKAVKSIDNE